MKTLIKISTILFIYTAIFSCEPCVIGHETSCYPSVQDSYEYSITAESDEWKKISTTKEALKLCQLPNDILKTISTKGLIEALKNSPMFIKYCDLSSAEPLDAWHNTYSLHNSANELFKRKDAGNILVEYCNNISIDCISTSLNSEDENKRLIGLEFLFTKKAILNKTNSSYKRKFVEKIMNQDSQRGDNWHSLAVVAWIMLDDKYPEMVDYYNENLKQYENTILKGHATKDQKLFIKKISYSYIKNEYP